MTPSDASRVVETLFADQWTLTPVVYENTPAKNFNEAGQPSLFDGSSVFIALEISPGYSRPITIPVGCVRRAASLLITVYVPRNTGSRSVDDVVSALVLLLQYKEYVDSTGTLRFKDLNSTSRNFAVGEWVQSIITVPFEYDHEVE